MILTKTIEEDGQIVGTAFVHLTSEVGLILSSKLTKLHKAKLIKEIFEVLYKELSATDLDDCHVFIVPETDTEYADFLIKHLGFKRDTSLVLFKEKANEQSIEHGSGEHSKEHEFTGSSGGGTNSNERGRESSE